jgi:hypothetical protein
MFLKLFEIIRLSFFILIQECTEAWFWDEPSKESLAEMFEPESRKPAKYGLG